MTKREAKKILVAVFRTTTKAQKANLLFHAERGTKIMCGGHSHVWIAHDGA